MNYNFNVIPDRQNCGATKWNIAKNASVDAVPLSVADMEFPTAEPIKKALIKLVNEQILGYTDPTQEYYDAVISWLKRRHHSTIKQEWIVTTPGIVTALGLLIEAVTNPGDTVVILTPVYYPFDTAVFVKSRKIVYSELIISNGKYEIDYIDLEKKIVSKSAKALLFCNPHNPVGRVWTKDELQKVADICNRNNVFIIDDEIHNDLIMPGITHTCMLNLDDATKNNIAVCTAPSKTFNLAGLQCSNIIIPNKKARIKTKACMEFNLLSHLNIFAYEACKTAYNECEDWLEELIQVIHSNAKYIESFMAEKFPEIKVFPLEGTYLQWLDMSGLGMTHVQLKNMLESADIYLDYGEMFGDLGRGFERINLACAKETLEKTMYRFEKAVNDLREKWAANGKPINKKLEIGDIIEPFFYMNAYGDYKQLKKLSGNTLIIFTAHYNSELCKKLLDTIKLYYPVFSTFNIDIKAIIPSSTNILSMIASKYPFEIIPDPNGELFEKYNVFEANSLINMLAGDKHFEKVIGKDIKKLLDTPFSDIYVNEANDEGFRKLQLCAFVGINANNEVIFSHYSKTIGDVPTTKALLSALRK